MIQIQFIDHDTIASLGRIADQVNNPDALLKVVAFRGAGELKKHFRARNTKGNRLGGRRTNFWWGVADKVNTAQVGPRQIRISVSHPFFLQKLYGGRITPKNAGALTIPIDPLAYDRTVTVFQRDTGIKLFRLRRKGGGFSNLLAGLVAKGEIKVFYVLEPDGVDQAPDPEALPDRGEFNAAILDQADRQLRLEIRTGGKP